MGFFGFTPIFYWLTAAYYKTGSKEYDNYINKPWSSRKIWSHWQSMLSCLLASHYMFTSNEHTVFIIIGFYFNCANVFCGFIELADDD